MLLFIDDSKFLELRTEKKSNYWSYNLNSDWLLVLLYNSIRTSLFSFFCIVLWKRCSLQMALEGICLWAVRVVTHNDCCTYTCQTSTTYLSNSSTILNTRPSDVNSSIRRYVSHEVSAFPFSCIRDFHFSGHPFTLHSFPDMGRIETAQVGFEAKLVSTADSFLGSEPDQGPS